MKNDKDKTQKDESGKALKTAIVKCDGFRCQATLWNDGKWRDSSGSELTVIEVLTEMPNP